MVSPESKIVNSTEGESASIVASRLSDPLQGVVEEVLSQYPSLRDVRTLHFDSNTSLFEAIDTGQKIRAVLADGVSADPLLAGLNDRKWSGEVVLFGGEKKTEENTGIQITHVELPVKPRRIVDIFIAPSQTQ